LRILLTFLIMTSTAHSYSFKDGVKAISSHEIVQSIENDSKALSEEADEKGSWGDPVFRITAKNFPKDSLSDDQTPMTGVEFGISQKVPLTTKYGNIEDAFKFMGKARDFEARNKREELIRNFWLFLIESKKLKEESVIIKENTNWISKILKVSKRLYANGKISQQALLDIQIRKSELETYNNNKEFDLEALQDKLSYLLGFNGKRVNTKTIPWGLLNSKGVKSSNKIVDNKELSLKSTLLAREKILMAQKLDYVPDLTFSVGYTKRSNIDDNGDFVSAMVSFPLPTSDKKYAASSKATFEKYSAQKRLENYKKFRKSDENRIETLIRKTESELKVLSTKTIKFSENSRKITSKSYSLGNTTYIELLKSEFKLQELLIRKSNIQAKLLKYKLDRRYLIGEKLYE